MILFLDFRRDTWKEENVQSISIISTAIILTWVIWPQLVAPSALVFLFRAAAVGGDWDVKKSPQDVTVSLGGTALNGVELPAPRQTPPGHWESPSCPAKRLHWMGFLLAQMRHPSLQQESGNQVGTRHEMSVWLSHFYYSRLGFHHSK
jgi:hypothetical protein